MPRGRPIEPETRAQIIALAREGIGRNEIARRLKVAGATVTAVTEPEGIVFDWSSTDLATRARRVQVGAMRTDLAHAALLRAGEMLESMSAPIELVHYQAKTEHDSGGWKRTILDGPTPSDMRNMATVFGILTSRAADLLRSTAGGGANADVVSVLGGIGEALSAVAESMSDPSSDPTAEPVVVDREGMIAELERQVIAAADEEDDL